MSLFAFFNRKEISLCLATFIDSPLENIEITLHVKILPRSYAQSVSNRSAVDFAIKQVGKNF